MATYSNGAYLSPIEFTGDKQPGVYFWTPNPIQHLDDLQPFYPEDEWLGLQPGENYGVVFYYPTRAGALHSVALEGQWLPIRPTHDFNQKISQTGSGYLSVYGKPFHSHVLIVNLGDLVPIAIRQRLWIFFRYKTEGALRKFEYEDETGKLYLCRLIDSGLNWDMKYWLKYNITLTIWVISQQDA